MNFDDDSASESHLVEVELRDCDAELIKGAEHVQVAVRDLRCGARGAPISSLIVVVVCLYV